MQRQPASNGSRRPQFSIAAILEYMAVCSVLLAFAKGCGVESCIFLIGMALTLSAKAGDLAIVMFVGASISTDFGLDRSNLGDSAIRLGLVVFLAALLCVWYRTKARKAMKLRDKRLLPKGGRAAHTPTPSSSRNFANR